MGKKQEMHFIMLVVSICKNAGLKESIVLFRSDDGKSASSHLSVLNRSSYCLRWRSNNGTALIRERLCIRVLLTNGFKN